MKNSTKFTKQTQEELNKSLEIGSTLSMVIGSVGLIIYIILSVALPEGTQWLDFILYISAILFGFGIVFLISVNKTNKNFRDEKTENEYEFFENYFTIDSTKNGEKVATVKVYYNEVFRLKQTKNYLFVFQNQYTSYPVDKKAFSQEELKMLINWIKLGISARKKIK